MSETNKTTMTGDQLILAQEQYTNQLKLDFLDARAKLLALPEGSHISQPTEYALAQERYGAMRDALINVLSKDDAIARMITRETTVGQEVADLDATLEAHAGQPLDTPYKHEGRFFKKRLVQVEPDAARHTFLEINPDGHAAFTKVDGIWHQVVLMELTQQVKRPGYSFPKDVSGITASKAAEALANNPPHPFSDHYITAGAVTEEQAAAQREENKEANATVAKLHRHLYAGQVLNADRTEMPKNLTAWTVVTAAKAREALAQIPKALLPLVAAAIRSSTIAVGLGNITRAKDDIQAYLERNTDISSRRIDKIARDLAEKTLYTFARGDGTYITAEEGVALSAALLGETKPEAAGAAALIELQPQGIRAARGGDDFLKANEAIVAAVDALPEDASQEQKIQAAQKAFRQEEALKDLVEAVATDAQAVVETEAGGFLANKD